MSVAKIHVDCLLNGELLKSYELDAPPDEAPGIPASSKGLEAEAMTSLTNDGIAYPPYDGITIKVRDP